jgi:hypothetical protein
MAERKATKDSSSRGGRKSEVITIRLDPRLKYLAELAARRQRRPLSSYVEWAIEGSLRNVRPGYDDNSFDAETSFADVAMTLWDVDEADRFAILALRYPELLTHDEQVVWKLIRENGYLWRGKYSGRNNEWQWSIDESSLVKDHLREQWETFLAVASGELPESKLPEWNKTKSAIGNFGASKSELDEEIPF